MISNNKNSGRVMSIDRLAQKLQRAYPNIRMTENDNSISVFEDFPTDRRGDSIADYYSQSGDRVFGMANHFENFLKRNGYWSEWVNSEHFKIYKLDNYAKGGSVSSDLEVTSIKYQETRRGISYIAQTNKKGVKIVNDGFGGATFVEGVNAKNYRDLTEHNLERLIDDYESKNYAKGGSIKGKKVVRFHYEVYNNPSRYKDKNPTMYGDKDDPYRIAFEKGLEKAEKDKKDGTYEFFRGNTPSKLSFAKGGKITDSMVWNNMGYDGDGEIIEHWASDVGGSNQSVDNIITYSNGKNYLVTTNFDQDMLVTPSKTATEWEDDDYAKGGKLDEPLKILSILKKKNSTMARLIRLSKKKFNIDSESVKSQVKKLIDLGVIKKEMEEGGDGWNTSRKYEVLTYNNYIDNYAEGGEIEDMSYEELMDVVFEENSSNQNEKLAKEIAKIQGFKYDAVEYADFHLVVRDYLDKSTNKNDDESREVLLQAFENTGIEYDDDDEYAKGGYVWVEKDNIMDVEDFEEDGEVEFGSYKDMMESLDEWNEQLDTNYTTIKEFNDGEEYRRIMTIKEFEEYKKDWLKDEGYAKGGEVKKKGNEMLIGGLAGILLGIFLNK